MEGKGIWRYANFYRELIRPKNRLALADGSTEELENGSINDMAGGRVFFKREDMNETESLKGRSLAYQISLAKRDGLRELVISTSGNAGIAAAAYCRKAGIKLYIFMSSETDSEKIASMQKYDPIIIRSNRAMRLANYLSAKKKIRNLRPSRDDSSIEGFKSIAFEIYEHLGEVEAIFTFVTSGSSFVGIGSAYEYLLKSGEIKKLPKLFAVQSGGIFSIAREFDKIDNTGPEDDKIAGKLGVKETRRKEEIIDLIKKSGGGSFYVAGSEMENACKTLGSCKIHTSPEGCASFAALLRWSKAEKFKKAVCVLSGKARGNAADIDESSVYTAESFEEVDEVVNKNVNIKMENGSAKI
jgi:threonine synthase